MLALVGCNQVLGLDPPAREVTVDAPATSDASSGADGAVTDGASDDASPIDASPIDARLIDARTDACIPTVDGNECTYDTCGNPPVPRDTLCNGGADQCDGDGNCVDCTTSGGCGECCTCSIGDYCVPA